MTAWITANTTTATTLTTIIITITNNDNNVHSTYLLYSHAKSKILAYK